MMTSKWELLFSILIPALVILLIAMLIGSGPSLDAVIFGR